MKINGVMLFSEESLLTARTNARAFSPAVKTKKTNKNKPYVEKQTNTKTKSKINNRNQKPNSEPKPNPNIITQTIIKPRTKTMNKGKMKTLRNHNPNRI